MLRLAYGHAEAMAYWWLDTYLDFDGAQTDQVRQGIAQWFAWHRRSQLPEYVALLDRAADEADRDATPAQACAWVDTLRARADLAVRQALPVAARVAVSLQPEQLERLSHQHAKVAEELRADYLQADPAERRAAAIERAETWAERLYGRLDAAQREQLAARVATSPFDADRWVAERLRRQRDLQRTLRSLTGATPQAAEAALLGVWQRVLQPPDETDARHAQALSRYNCEAAAAFHNRTTPAQRDAAQHRLRDWQADLRLLAAGH